MKPLLVINEDRCAPGTLEILEGLGYDYILTEGLDAPAVQSVPTKEDRRFTAAVTCLQGLASRMTEERFSDLYHDIQGGRKEAKVAVQLADALLVELSKDE